MADAIERLRGLWKNATDYLITNGPEHDGGCPEDDTCTCETGTNLRALDECVQALPALLAVAEAAKKLVEHTYDFDLETALANLEKHG